MGAIVAITIAGTPSKAAGISKKENNFTKDEMLCLRCTGQIKFLTAVMNNMAVPEKIYFVIDTMYPVARKIQYDKGY